LDRPKKFHDPKMARLSGRKKKWGVLSKEKTQEKRKKSHHKQKKKTLNKSRVRRIKRPHHSRRTWGKTQKGARKKRGENKGKTRGSPCKPISIIGAH